MKSGLFKKASFAGILGLAVGVLGVIALGHRFPVGPVVLLLSVIPLGGLFMAGRPMIGAVPDIIFGALDTGLLTIPALWGGILYGVAGAIAGGVIGDAITDGIAGFFEGYMAEWLRARGVEESREPLTTALGKMAGCLLGSGLVLTAAFLLGIEPEFG